MLRSVGKRARSVGMLGAFAALALAGVATAQGGSQDQGGHPAGPPLGAPMKGLTYAEFHVQTKNGEEKTIRLDEGKIVTVDSSSITLSENDGSEVTVALDEGTQVLGKPGEETSLEDLEAGMRVAVCGPEGGTAKTVMIVPKKGEGPPQGQAGPQGQQGQPGPQGQRAGS
jgi:hypothetical protein